MISATIPGKPMGEPRARFARVGRFVRTYTTAKSTSYRSLVQHYVGEAMRASRLEPIVGPIVVEIDAFSACPKTQQRKREPTPQRPSTTKPDVDNVAKIILDSLNGVAWIDDAQVCDVRVRKYIAAQDQPPRVVVRIAPADSTQGP